VDRCFPSREQLLGVMEMARTMASKSPLALRGCKEMFAYTRDSCRGPATIKRVDTMLSGLIQGLVILTRVFYRLVAGRSSSAGGIP